MDKRFFDRASSMLPEVFFETAPDIGIVLGSGWGASLQMDEVISRISYSDIPGMGAATVPGHAGEIILYRRGSKRVVAFCGRRHWYEGVGWEAVVMPIEFLRLMGCRKVLLTNAAGGINAAFGAGQLCVVTDHINSVGQNPLIGLWNECWGPRFPDMTEVYSKRMSALLHEGAKRLGIDLKEGVYCFTSGPVFETPAEIRAYRTMGADLVGMSTVPEATFAHACGIEVACLSLSSNPAAGITGEPLRHEDVLRATNAAKDSMAALIDDFLERV